MQSTIYVEMAPGVTTDDLYLQLLSAYKVCSFEMFWREALYNSGESLLASCSFFVFNPVIMCQYSLQDEVFVRLLERGVVPHTRHVRGSNDCFMNVFADRIPGRAIIISVVRIFSDLKYHQTVKFTHLFWCIISDIFVCIYTPLYKICRNLYADW